MELGEPSSAAERRPNIVFVLSDDHAAHAIGCYGSVVNRTPRIDEIAGQGCRLDNCFVTNALCTPPRAAILTGTYSDPAYAEVREQLKSAMWREQARLGDAPHPSQPVPVGCEDVPVAPPPKPPSYRWVNRPGQG